MNHLKMALVISISFVSSNADVLDGKWYPSINGNYDWCKDGAFTTDSILIRKGVVNFFNESQIGSYKLLRHGKDTIALETKQPMALYFVKNGDSELAAFAATSKGKVYKVFTLRKKITWYGVPCD